MDKRSGIIRKNNRVKINFCVFAFILLVIALALWWYYLLPLADKFSLSLSVIAVSICISALTGLLIVGNMFAFANVQQSLRKLRGLKPKYVQMLRDDNFCINIMRQKIIAAITESLSVEERTDFLERLFYVSILCGAVNSEDADFNKMLKKDLIKNGYSNKDGLRWFDDYVTQASVDGYEFFSLIEELVTSSGYKRFDVDKSIVDQLSTGFFAQDCIGDDMWTIRGGQASKGFTFKYTIVLAIISIIGGILLVTCINKFTVDLDNIWNTYRILAGIIISLGVFSVFLIGRYIFEATSCKI